MELINEVRFSGHEYHNELTREMDKHLKPSYKDGLEYLGGDGTYLCNKDKATEHYPSVYAIRYPGATRGHIVVDENNCIVSVRLYETACVNCIACYETSVSDVFEKYIGAKIFDYKNESNVGDGVFLITRCLDDIGEMDTNLIDTVLEERAHKRQAVICGDGGTGASRNLLEREDFLNSDALIEIVERRDRTSKSIGKKMAMLMGVSAMLGGISGYDSGLIEDLHEPIRGKCLRDLDGKCNYYKRVCRRSGCKKYEGSN